MARADASAGKMKTNDGSDHEYRMVVEDRYKRMAKARKTIKNTAWLALMYILLRTVWKFMPSIRATSHQYAYTDHAILVGGVGLYMFYRYAFGYGRAQHEKQWAVFAYTIASMFLLAECFLTFWIYHVMLGSQSLDKGVAATYPPIPKGIAATLQQTLHLSRKTTAGLETGLGYFEKAFEVLGLGLWFVGVFTVREYAVDMRDSAREKTAQRKAGLKAQ